MKKPQLIVILVAATLLIFGVAYLAMNELLLTPNNIATTTIAPTKITNTSKIHITKNTYNNQNIDKSVDSNSINELTAAQNINIAQTAQLSAYSNQFTKSFTTTENSVSQSIQKAINTKKGPSELIKENIYSSKLWNTQITNLLSVIRENIGGKQLQVFNAQVNFTRNFINSEIQTTQNSQVAGNLQYLDAATQMLYMTGREANFLLYNYIVDNGINPQFADQYATTTQKIFNSASGHAKQYTPQQLALIKQYTTEFNNLEKTSNDYINDVTNGKLDVSTAYTDIFNNWNDTLNKLYQELSSVNGESETPAEYNQLWSNYKKQMLKLESQMYSNPLEQTLATQRLNIRLTQMECYNLLNQFASTAFLHH